MAALKSESKRAERSGEHGRRPNRCKNGQNTNTMNVNDERSAATRVDETFTQIERGTGLGADRR